MPKKVQLQVGVQGNLNPFTVEIPEDHPRPWDGVDQLKVIGHAVPRLEAQAKVSGLAKYTIDIQLAGMLYAKFWRCPYPAAKITHIDTSKAEKAPGVRGIVFVQEKLPFFVRYAGQEVLAIAADTLHHAEEALALVEIKYKLRPFVVDIEKARQANAPEVFGTREQAKDKLTDADEGTGSTHTLGRSGNAREAVESEKGGTLAEIQAALMACAVRNQATYRTQVQTHSALEPHGVVAHWEEGNLLKVWASTQSTFSVQGELTRVFNLPGSQVRVFTEHMGGGFGAKFGAGLYGVSATRLAQKTKAPVHLVFDRKEEHSSGGNRPSSVQEVQLGANAEGKLEAILLSSYGTAGIATGSGTSHPFKSLYECSKIYTKDQDIFTNASPGAAFRAPGHPQGLFALEQSIDDLAYQLALDPLEIRKRNTLHHEIRQREYELGEKAFGWEKRNPKVGADSGILKRGVGVANSLWYYIYGVGFQASLKVHRDGSVEILNGVQDIGTGIRTTIGMVVAEELSLPLQQIQVHIGDTTLGYGPPSGGSQTTAGITPAIRQAAYQAKLKMLELAAPLLETTASELILTEGRFALAQNPQKSVSWKQVAGQIPGDHFMVMGERVPDYFEPKVEGHPYSERGKRGLALIAGVQFVEVEVDTETGVIQVKRVVAVHDCGRTMNALTLESQIQGGIIQGISYALFEDRILDASTGQMVNPNLEQYKIAGSLDIPPMEIIVLDENRGTNSTGAKGIGEPATAPTAAAIANAVYHAIGVRVYDLPLTPDKILAALEREAASRGKK
jgi:xanthine dehydrogenase YagR molybdenum-binding subunit